MATNKEMVTVLIMGQAYKVPAEATIMGAIEYAGYQIKRGAGCREGFCRMVCGFLNSLRFLLKNRFTILIS